MFGKSISVRASERQDSVLLELGAAEWPHFLDFHPFVKSPFPVWKSFARLQGRERFCWEMWNFPSHLFITVPRALSLHSASFPNFRLTSSSLWMSVTVLWTVYPVFHIHFLS